MPVRLPPSSKDRISCASEINERTAFAVKQSGNAGSTSRLYKLYRDLGGFFVLWKGKGDASENFIMAWLGWSKA